MDKNICEYSSGDQRTIDKRSDYTGFYKKDQKFVLLSADLKAMGSPDKYRIIFYFHEGNITESNWRIDYTDCINMPPPDYIITTIPSSLALRPGGKASIEV